MSLNALTTKVNGSVVQLGMPPTFDASVTTALTALAAESAALVAMVQAAAAAAEAEEAEFNAWIDASAAGW